MKLTYGSEIQRETGFGFTAVHTGIYIGNDEVIHFDGESSSANNKSDIVKKSTLNEFLEGKKMEIRENPINDEHARNIVERAKKIMENEDNKYNGNYGLIFGEHCQDFTKDCYEVEY